MSESTLTTAIVESDNFIILEKHTKLEQPSQYQTEADLEKELIADLHQQGYEYLTDLTTPKELLANLKTQMEILNNVVFTDDEWLIVPENFMTTIFMILSLMMGISRISIYGIRKILVETNCKSLIK